MLRPLSGEEFSEIQNKNEDQVFVMTEFLKEDFLIPHTTVSSQIQATMYEEALNIVSSLPHRKNKDSSLLEASRFKSISLFYYTRFILFNRFALALREFKAYTIFKDQLAKDDTLVIFGVSPYLERGIGDSRITVKLPDGAEKAMSLLRLGLIFLLRTLIGVFYLLRLKKARHLFIIPPAEKQPILNQNTLKPELGNPITDYFTDALFERADSYSLEEFYPARFVKSKINKRNIFGIFPGKAIFLEPFLALAFIKSKINKSAITSLRLNERKAYEDLMETETDETYRLANLINLDLFRMRKFAAIRMTAAELFFKKAQVKSIGGIDEYSVRTKSVLDVAKVSGGHTYSFQHGVVHKNHAGYHYLPKDAENVILVDDLFIYGTSTKEMLEFHNYPGNINISGQIRTDIIPRLKAASTSITIDGLSPNKPMVLWATQPDLPGDEPSIRDSISKDFFRLTKEFPDVNFVLKLHPRESDLTYYQKLAEEVGTTNYLISKSDLFLLLSKCNMLLTHCSAVGAETVYFNKPLIVQDYKNVDILNYIKLGVGIKASNYLELKNAVGDILNGTKDINKEAYKEYQQYFNGNIDGKVVERIIARITA